MKAKTKFKVGERGGDWRATVLDEIIARIKRKRARRLKGKSAGSGTGTNKENKCEN